MKWDIDRAMMPYEPNIEPGTIWQRVRMQVSVARREGLKIPDHKTDRDSVLTWCVGVGVSQWPKFFVYGYTMRECFLRLRKQAKLKRVQLNPQLFPRLWRKAKPKERRRKPAKKEVE